MIKISIGVRSAAVILMIAGCSPGKNSGGEIAMFRRSSEHTGIYESAPIVKTPALQWQFKTNGPINGTAAIDGEKIYIGSGDSTFYCLDRSSGRELWKFRTNGGIQSSPAISDGLVMFGSFDGYFYALNASNGKLQWKFETEGEKQFSARGLHGRQPKDSVFIDDWDFYLSSPAVADRTVFFGTGSGFIYALDISTGKQIWKFKTDGVVHASPAVGLGHVYVGSWDSYFYAIDQHTGREKWKTQTGTDTAIFNQTGFQGSALISDSMIYVGCRDSKIYGFHAITGETKWSRFNDYGWVSSSPAVADDKVIYLTADTQMLTVLNKTTGDSILSVQTKSMVFSSPALVGNYLYFGELNGSITARNAESGAVAWSYLVPSAKEDKHKLLKPDSTLNYDIVFSKDKQAEAGLSALELVFALGAVLSSPVVEDGILYCGSSNGYFYALQ